MKIKELLKIINPIENILIMDYYEGKILASYWFDEEKTNINSINNFNNTNIMSIKHGVDNITIITDIK